MKLTTSHQFRCRHLLSAVVALITLALIVLPQPWSSRAQETDLLRASDPPPNAIWVDGLDLNKMIGRQPRAGKALGGGNPPPPLKLNEVVYPHGIGTSSNTELQIDLKGEAVRFASMVGVDDNQRAGVGSVVFEVWVDGKKAADSGLIRSGNPPKLLSADLTGAKRLALFVGDGGDSSSGDNADWAGAMITLAPNAKSKPETLAMSVEPAPPIASGVSPKPAIHGPRITGASPGKPFLFLIPATGEGPLTFSAKNLPAGLTLDPKTGIISGSLKASGTTSVELTVRGPQGSSARELTIVGGENKLALTPPMGWNSWNVWAGSVDAAKVRAAADAMVKSGLAAHGYQYINIDDTWEAKRDESGEILTNDKFGDMKALADYVHSQGLKLGIYSSPGPQTCARFEGSYQHEEQDAKTYAKWGIDYLKYDWCSYGQIARNPTLPDRQKPYAVMQAALAKIDRDIVYSLCQYGGGNVWEWGAEVGGNLWRTTGDITDTWSSLAGIGFNQSGHEKHAGPGHWNDPDMLIVGRLGWGPRIHPTRLTQNEQITHITLWSLQSAPLLIGCDMSEMDKFTIDLLGNDEVVDVDQDPLGKPAGRRALDGKLEVWARPLWDGTMAVGLFNRDSKAAKVTAKWSDLGLKGSQPVRDLWQQKNLGNFSDSFSMMVPQHGAVLVKIGRPNK